jgi:hypothetical protein
LNTDHERAAPYVTWHGVEFVHGQETPVDASQHGELIRAARDNPWFEIVGGDGTQASPGTQEEGQRAAAKKTRQLAKA